MPERLIIRSGIHQGNYAWYRYWSWTTELYLAVYPKYLSSIDDDQDELDIMNEAPSKSLPLLRSWMKFR